jgi:plastocyanin
MRIRYILSALALTLILIGTIAAARSRRAFDDKAMEAAVTITNFQFDPKELHVKVGTTVTWTNKEGAHTVASDDGKTFESPTLSAGQTFSHQFKKAGRYPYYCTFHGSKGGHDMAGVIIVEK